MRSRPDSTQTWRGVLKVQKHGIRLPRLQNSLRSTTSASKNASDDLLSRVVFTYDEAGGNLIEELQTRAPDAFPDFFEDAPPDELNSIRAVFQSISEPTRISHRYDHNGCRVETRTQLGLLSDHSKKRSYNEHGEPISETGEEHSRAFGPDDQGQIGPVEGSERESSSETRLNYEYDEYGNWTKQAVEGRSGTEEAFSISSIENRTISYFK